MLKLPFKNKDDKNSVICRLQHDVSIFMIHYVVNKTWCNRATDWLLKQQAQAESAAAVELANCTSAVR